MPHTGAAEREGQGRVGSENPVAGAAGRTEEAAGAIRERSQESTSTAAAAAVAATAGDATATGDDQGHDGATEGDTEADGGAQALHAE